MISSILLKLKKLKFAHNRMKIMGSKLSVLTAFLLLLSIKGYTQDTLASRNMDEVVITGQYQQQTLRKSVHQVKVINREDIERQGASRVQDVLINQLNIRFSQDVATGGSNITMLGLKGQNVKILIDGVPMIGKQGINNEININQVDINTVERIEIVEGPMSVVYGADALAGVINIITKKAPKNSWALNVRLHEETIGNEFGFFDRGLHNPSADISRQKGKWEIGLNGSLNYFAGWQDTAIGRELVWNKRDQRLGGGFIRYASGGLNIRYRLDALDELITDPGNFIYPQVSSNDTLAINKSYFSNRVMQQLQGSYAVNNKLSLFGQAAYTVYNRQVLSTTISKQTKFERLDLTPESQSNVKTTGSNVRFSGVYTASPILSFQPGVELNTETGEGERLKSGLSKITDIAVFATAEYQGIKNLNIRPGVRFIKNSVYDAPPVVPSINIKYAISNNLDWRFAYAHGFRAPSIRELNFNFFDINHQIIGNPHLKAEISNTFTTSLSYTRATQQAVNYNLTLNAFYNHVNNLIDYAINPTNSNEYTLTNIYDSKNAGASVAASLTKGSFNINTGVGMAGFYNDFSPLDNSLPEMQWSPEVNTVVGYTFSPAGIDANFFYKFVGSRPGYIQNGNDLVAIKTQGYHLSDLSVGKFFNRKIRLQAGVRNLFDVKRITASSNQVSVHTNNNVTSIATGRGYFATLTYKFLKQL